MQPSCFSRQNAGAVLALEAVHTAPAETAMSWGLEYEDGEPSDIGAVRALELAHAAK